MTTCRAEQWRAMAAAIRPIGPAPVINTSSPITSNDSAVWVALPSGSKELRTSSEMPESAGHTLVTGSERNSANAPSRLTPTPLVLGHRWRRPARQLRQWPHTTWPSPLTRSPGLKSVTLSPTSSTVPTNSWPTTVGTRIVFCAQASQFQMCTSVPQMLVFRMRISTWFLPTSGIGTSWSHRPSSAFDLTSAFTLPRLSSQEGSLSRLRACDYTPAPCPRQSPFRSLTAPPSASIVMAYAACVRAAGLCTANLKGSDHGG